LSTALNAAAASVSVSAVSGGGLLVAKTIGQGTFDEMIKRERRARPMMMSSWFLVVADYSR